MNALIPLSTGNALPVVPPSQPKDSYHKLSRKVPPCLGVLLLLDELRVRLRDPAATLSDLLLLLRGRLAHALPALRRELIPGDQFKRVNPDLLELVHLRGLALDGKYSRLRRLLRGWSKSGNNTLKAEALRLRRNCMREGSAIWKRLLSQELLLRSSGEEDWLYHEARWQYHQMQKLKLGKLSKAANYRRRAREAGVLFDPAQIELEACWSLSRLRELLQLMPTGLPLALLQRFRAGGVWELRLPLEVWPHLSPLLSLLAAGTNHLELPLESWPCTLPDCGSDPGTLVLYRRDEAAPRGGELDSVCAAGWQVIVLCDEDASPGGLPLLDSGIRRGRIHLQSSVSRNTGTQVMPLKDFVRRVERRYIEEVLSLHSGVKTRACASLCITRQTLYSKLSSGEARAAERKEL